ncbi:5'-nucleotidase [Nocardioides sp. J9]|uniref:ExeM/NucH family extracellular endonuclease n=1 Tax=Nocardioides sp. J9 TaxID=935844 RepID=UPI0011A37CD5|nr:ExeM/NucH family extracellular endonuclease [Nocardioides sp. J9]TWH04268.1 5'-nucleotidase [Nocardioides sp. J9]
MRPAKQLLFGSLGAAITLSGLTVVAASPVAANPEGTGLVINEVYGGGGNSGATYKSDFVELFNPTGAPISVDGWSIQYRAEAGATAVGTSNITPLAGTVPAHGYFLVKAADGAGSQPALPDPDVVGTIAMGGGGGQVFLVDNTTLLSPGTGNMVGVPGVVDMVGWGSASGGTYSFEGTGKAPGTVNSTSISRNATHADTDDNAADFTTGGPTPQNSSVTEGDPEPQDLAAGSQSDIVTTVDAQVSATLTASGGTEPYSWATGSELPDGLSLSAAGVLSGSPNEQGTFPVTATVSDSSDPVQTDDVSFTITVGPAPEVLPIATIQGNSDRSPYAPATGTGQGPEQVTTTGVVTGFYQDPAFANSGFDGFTIQTGGTGGSTDATPGASDGIFVYYGNNNPVPSGIEVGDSVRVTGRVSEFFGLTEINTTAAQVVELGTPLPPVTPVETPWPTTESEREALESMLIAPTGEFTVTNSYSTNQYAEVGLAAGDEPLKQPTEFADAGDEAALQAVRDENAERAITLDDGTGVNYLANQTTKAQPVPWLTQGNAANPNPPRVGAGVEFHAPVVLDFRNDIWKLQPQTPVTTDGAAVATFEDTRSADAAGPKDVLGATGDLTIATFNVLNYFNTTGEAYAAAGPQQDPPLNTFCTYYTDRQSNRIGNNSCGVRLLDDPDTEQNEANTNDGRGPRGAATAVSLARQEEKLAHTINALGADVIGLEEIENSIKLPGETNRDDALARLVEVLNVAAPDTWAYVKSPGKALTADAVAEQDTIRGAFIYKKQKVEPVGSSDMLFGTDEFANAREPLAQVFKAKGAPDSDGFAVIVNHFKSKGDSCTSNEAQTQPEKCAAGDNEANAEVGAFNGDRVRQATRLLQFAEDFAAARDVEPIFLAGDFNSYTMEEPIKVLTSEDAGFQLIESDEESDESYSFSGLSGSLDHVLANDAAMAMVTGADIWEINANEAASFQYSRYNYNVTDFWLPNQPWGTSDHNPEVVGIDVPDFTPTEYDEVQVVGTNDFHGRLLPDGGNAAGAAPFATALEELRQQNPDTVFVAAGDLIGASTFESFIQDDEPTIDVLNEMGLEVSAAGNHEFDRGYADLAGRVRDRAEWEYIASNLDYDASIAEEDRVAETFVAEVGGKRIGFVGAVTEDLPNLVNQEGIEGITVTDVVDATNAAAAELKSGDDPVDLVVLLVHEGAPTTDCSSPGFTDPATVFGNIAQGTSADVDAIISGHTHLAYNCRYTVDEWVTDERAVTKRPVVSAGQYGTNLNQLVFKFEQGTDNLVAIGQDVVAAAGVGYAPDPAVQAIVDAAVEVADEQGSEVLGSMDGEFRRASYLSSAGATENRGGESTLSNLVAEAQRSATGADIAFMNPGGLRADMLGTEDPETDLRDLTYRQAADVQPFANTLVTVGLTGAQIKTVLEQQWQRTPAGTVPSRPFLRLGASSGFTYTYVETPQTVSVPGTAPVNTFKGTVTGMWLDGEPVDLGATYTVAANSFLAAGGDNFRELANGADKKDTGKVDLAAMVEFMEQYDEQNPLEVDYSQRAVLLELPADAPEAYAPGDTVEFSIGSWAMTAPGDKQDTELQVRLGDEVLGSVPVDNTVGNKPYDSYGTASVSVTLPGDVAEGVRELTVVGPTTGTSVPLLIDVSDGVRDIQIIGTNDFHGRLMADEAPATATCAEGTPAPPATVLCPAERLAGTVKQLREEYPDTVFAAAGDLIGASTFESFIQKDEPTIDALNEAGLEVSAAGNHEFDQGYEDLVGRVQDRADWEYIAANVEEPEGRDDLAETWTKDFGGVTVGFVGAVTEELPSLVTPAGIEGLTVTDIVDATNAAAADLKEDGADLVVLLVHEGSGSTSCASPQFTNPGTVWGNITQNVSADVDAIISGHTHLAYNCSFPVQEWVDGGRAVTERPVVSAGQYGQNVNQLVFSVDEATGEVVATTQEIIAITASSPGDTAVREIVDAAKEVAEELGSVKIGEIAAPFNRARVEGSTDPNRGGESTLNNLVAEVQRWATESPESGAAEIAFMNPGGLRSDMAGTPVGGVRELTYKGAAVVQPFANTLVNMDLTGAQIKTVLEQQWQRTADEPPAVPSRPFLKLGVSKGFTYTYVERPVLVGPEDAEVPTFEGEITGMWLNGEPIDLAETYSVTVNSFLASGGDNFRELANGTDKKDTGKVDLAAMVDYMAEFSDEEPLPVDYSQRAVQVELPADAPAAYAPGDRVRFDVGSWAMTAPGDVQDDELLVKLGDQVLGAAAVDNTVGTERYDQYGTASVDVALTGCPPAGDTELTLVGEATGTEVRVPITVLEADGFATCELPTISGTPKVGNTLTGVEGTFSPEPDDVTYQWLADGAEIDGATASTYTLTPAEVDKVITFRVTASGAGLDDASADSEPTAPVARGTIVNSVKPTVTGTVRVGRELTAHPGVWLPAAGDVSYQWLADGAVLGGKTAPKLRLTGALAGKRISVRVTVGAEGYADATATSVKTAKVARGPVNMRVRTGPAKVVVKKTQVRVTVTLTNPDGLAVTGKVTVAASGIKARSAKVVNGKAVITLARFPKVGTKRVKVTYAGSKALNPRTTNTSVFVVRR